MQFGKSSVNVKKNLLFLLNQWCLASVSLCKIRVYIDALICREIYIQAAVYKDLLGQFTSTTQYKYILSNSYDYNIERSLSESSFVRSFVSSIIEWLTSNVTFEWNY